MSKKITISEKLEPKGIVNLTIRHYPLMERASDLLNEPDIKIVLENEFPYVPTRVIEEAIKTQKRIANGETDFEFPKKLMKFLSYTETKIKTENMFTNNGLLIASKNFAKHLGAEYFLITDNTTTPTVADKLTDFADPTVDKFSRARLFLPPYNRGQKAVYKFAVGFPKAIFTWEKVGLTNKNDVLLTVRLYNFSGKTNTTTINIDYEVTL